MRGQERGVKLSQNRDNINGSHAVRTNGEEDTKKGLEQKSSESPKKGPHKTVCILRQKEHKEGGGGTE